MGRGHFFQTIILSTNNPMLSSELNVLFHNSIHKLSDVKNTFMSRGHFFQTIVLSINNPMLTSKLNIRTQNSVLSCQMWKTSFTNRDCFYETIILSTNNPMLSSKMNVLSHNSLPSCQIWKIPSQAGVVVLQKLFWVSTILYYLQNWTFHIIFLFTSILFALCLHKPHFFYFSSAILIALNENLELTILCRLRDFFKD